MKVVHLAHIRPLEHVTLPANYFQRRLLHSFKKSVVGIVGSRVLCAEGSGIKRTCSRYDESPIVNWLDILQTEHWVLLKAHQNHDHVKIECAEYGF